MLKKPKILNRQEIARSRVFVIETVDLEFSNGAHRTYECFKSQGYKYGAVLVVPVTENNELVLVREYAVGVDQYELTFPKGVIDAGEQAAHAAMRELKEEAGCGAQQLDFIRSIAISPGYMENTLDIFVAQQLFPEKLEGDEPEVMEVIRWPLDNYQELLMHPEFNGALSLSALLLAKEFLHDQR